jgi:hypothetical protein
MKKCNVEARLTTFDSCDFSLNIQGEITKKMTESINEKLDDLVVKGLESKGYFFKDRKEVESFVKDNVQSKDFIDKNETIYYVKGTPFLRKNNNPIFNASWEENKLHYSLTGFELI